MADNNINIAMSAKDAGVIRLLDQQEKAIGKIIGKLDKVEKESKKGARQVTDDQRKAKKAYESTLTPLEKYQREVRELDRLKKKGLITNETYNRSIRKQNTLLNGSATGFANVAKSMGKWVVAGGAVYTMLAQVRREYENLKQVQMDARDSVVSLATAQEQMMSNLGPNSGMSKKEVLKEIKNISARTGVSQVVISTAASDVFSARGNATPQEALKTVEQVARVSALNSGNIPIISGASLDFANAFGSTPQEGLGFLQAVGTKARVTDTFKLAQNAAPSIIGANAFGATPRQAGAAYGTITSAAADFKGAAGGTGTISLAQQLFERMPELKDFDTRIKQVQSSQEEFDKFFNGGEYNGQKFPAGSFEKKVLGPIRKLLSPQMNEVRERYDKFLNEIPKVKDSAGFFNDVVGLHDIPTIKTAKANMAMNTAVEGLQISNLIGAQGAIGRDTVKRGLQAAGASNLSQRLAILKFEASSNGGTKNPLGAAADAFDTAAEGMIPKETVTVSGKQIVVLPPRSITEGELQTIDVLKGIAADLREMSKGINDLNNKKQEPVVIKDVNNKARPAKTPRTKQLSR